MLTAQAVRRPKKLVKGSAATKKYMAYLRSLRKTRSKTPCSKAIGPKVAIEKVGKEGFTKDSQAIGPKDPCQKVLEEGFAKDSQAIGPKDPCQKVHEPKELKAKYSKKASPKTPKRSTRKSPMKKASPSAGMGTVPSSRNMTPRRLRESMMSKKRARELAKPDVPLIDLNKDDDDDLIQF